MLTTRIARHPRRALLGALAFLLVAVVLGGPVFGVLEDGDGFVARDAESTRAVEAVERASGTQATPAVVALVQPKIKEIVDLGEDVVVVPRISARGSGSGVPVAQELAVV